MDAPLALYRRYRPETFAEVIGQDHVTEPLRNALANNRVNHAYLFSGPRGCGKTTSARILARAINCERGPAPEPCGECRSCQDLARGGPGSIDVIEIDAASHGGVDDARDLRERAFFAPAQSRFKIYIIDEAHMVTTQGFNALLKLVEEPPPHLKFIFATTEPDKVIGTIRSRTHHYPFRLVPPKVLADYLGQLCESEGVSVEPAVLPVVVRAGAGSVRDSLSVLDQLIGGAGEEGVTYRLAVALLGFTPDSLLDSVVDAFAAHDAAAVFEAIDKVIDTGQDPKRFAEDLLHRLRDLVIVAAVPTAISSGLIEVAEDQAERLQTQVAGLGAAELTRAADIVAAGLLEMRGATAPRLQLELICAKVLLPGADDSTQGVHARLDRIERRMTLGGPVAEVPAETSEGTTGREAARAAAKVSRTAPSPSAPSPEATEAPVEQPVVEETPPPAPEPAPEAVEPAPVEKPAAGQIGLADVRRLWPDILQRVKERKKVTWVMLSQNAQVLDLDDKVLTIGMSHAGVRENFVRSGHDQILREALLAELLVDRRVEAVVDPSTGGSPAGGQAVPAATATETVRERIPEPPAEVPVAEPPAEPPADRSNGGVEAARKAAREARNGNGGQPAAKTTPSPPAADAAAEEPDDSDGHAFADDDVVLEDDSRSHTELLRETLGAQVIDEQPNG